MIKTKTITHFGKQYSIKQFDAVTALELMGQDNISPHVVLANVEPNNIDEINCELGLASPYMVLCLLMNIVLDFSLGMDKEWKPVRIPMRFRSNVENVSSKAMHPVIATLIANDKATLAELSTIYSLPDALAMIDVMVAHSINSALAQEQASKA